MSVPKGKRGLSRTEFYRKAYVLNDALTRLLIKDFGIKSITRDLNTFTRNAKMNQEDRTQFQTLCEKYHIDVESEYPLWLIEHYRSSIINSLDSLISNITHANTIYATTVSEFELRRNYQWRAIGDCKEVLQTLQTVIRVLPVDANKYMKYVDLINEELELLKHWKKEDNKLLAKIKSTRESQ